MGIKLEGSPRSVNIRRDANDIGLSESPIPASALTVDAKGSPPPPPGLEGKRSQPHQAERPPSGLERHLSWLAAVSPPSPRPAVDTPATLTEEELRADNQPISVSRTRRESEMKETLSHYLHAHRPTPPMPIVPRRPKPSEPGYETDSTLELESESEDRDDYSRENSVGLRSLEGQSSREEKGLAAKIRAPGSPMAQTKKARYTHGHALQRMPGQVKGFGVVPHFHHKVHGVEESDSEAESGGSTSENYADDDTGVKVGEVLSKKGDHLCDIAMNCAKGRKKKKDSAFLNLNMNLTETGRDVRVLVRSKQIKPGAGHGLGCTVEDFEKIIDDLIIEEPMLFEEIDDEYHRKLVCLFSGGLLRFSS